MKIRGARRSCTFSAAHRAHTGGKVKGFTEREPFGSGSLHLSVAEVPRLEGLRVDYSPTNSKIEPCELLVTYAPRYRLSVCLGDIDLDTIMTKTQNHKKPASI